MYKLFLIHYYQADVSAWFFYSEIGDDSLPAKKSYTFEIKQPVETNLEKNSDFLKTLESALLLSLLDKEFINQEEFELCSQRIRRKK